MTLGNLLGAVLPFKRIAERNDGAIFIADLHALTSVKSAEDLKRNTHEMILTYFAIFGIDTPVHIFRQSDIPLIPKLNWILNNVTPYSLMLRAHSFKDFSQKRDEDYTPLKGDENIDELREYISNLQAQLDRRNEELFSGLNMGVFNYPILMAADILAYDTDIVPV